MTPSEYSEAALIVIKRLLKWIGWLIGGALAIGFVFALYIGINEWQEKRPQLITLHQGITLGDKYSDFMFKNPGFVVEVQSDNDSAGEQFYNNDEKRLSVTIRDGIVSGIKYFCNKNSDLLSVNGIRCESSGDEILSKYSNKVRILCKKDKSLEDHLSYRVFDSIAHGVRYLVKSNAVVGFFVVSEKDLEGYVGKSWVPCE